MNKLVKLVKVNEDKLHKRINSIGNRIKCQDEFSIQWNLNILSEEEPDINLGTRIGYDVFKIKKDEVIIYVYVAPDISGDFGNVIMPIKKFEFKGEEAKEIWDELYNMAKIAEDKFFANMKAASNIRKRTEEKRVNLIKQRFIDLFDTEDITPDLIVDKFIPRITNTTQWRYYNCISLDYNHIEYDLWYEKIGDIATVRVADKSDGSSLYGTIVYDSCYTENGELYCIDAEEAYSKLEKLFETLLNTSNRAKSFEALLDKIDKSWDIKEETN